MSVGLPPCPFCGNEHPDIVSGDGVYCDQCWASVPFDSWNRRTPGPATVKMVSQLRHDLKVFRLLHESPSSIRIDINTIRAFLAEHEPAKDDAKDDTSSSGQ